MQLIFISLQIVCCRASLFENLFYVDDCVKDSLLPQKYDFNKLDSCMESNLLLIFEKSSPNACLTALSDLIGFHYIIVESYDTITCTENSQNQVHNQHLTPQ